MKPFTFWLAKRLVKTDYVSLPNLLAGRELVKELLQEECEPQKLAAALLPLLANGKTSHAMHDTFRELHQQIRCNADEQAALHSRLAFSARSSSTGTSSPASVSLQPPAHHCGIHRLVA